MEVATMHGVARVMVKGHNEKRQRDLSRRHPAPNDGQGIRRLAQTLANMGLGGAVHRGKSTDGPIH